MKKKIIILSLKGGYGHVATGNALYEYLKNDYDVEVAYIFDNALSEIDIVSKVSRKYSSFNTIYNRVFLQGYFQSLLPFLMKLAKIFLKFVRKKSTKILISFLQEKKPDVVISVVPLINAALFSATKTLNIPVFLIPTDLDMHHFLVDLPEYLYKKSYICLIHENNFIKKQLKNSKISIKYIRHIGAVLRPDFFEEKNVTELKDNLYIEPKKSVIMILLGGLGSNKIINFAQLLSTFGLPAHFLFCVGKNEEAGEEIRKISFEPYLSYNIIGFTDRISDFMAISDIIITKSGTLSVLEGLYMQKPLLLDATGKVLPWEQYNHTLVEESGCGFSVDGYEFLIPRLLLLLSHKQYIKQIKLHLQQFERKNGAQELKKLLEETV